MPRVLLLSNPRSGSTFLGELLNSLPECCITRELLNNEEEIENDNALKYIENIIAKFPETYVGFKAFPEQIFERNLSFNDLVTNIGVTFVIILWRDNFLENFTSFKIAENTGVWYSNDTSKSTGTHTVEINPEEIETAFKVYESDWEKIGNQWPAGVQSIFVRYEDLIQDPDKWTRLIFSRLSYEVPNEFHFRSEAKRQNPAKLSQKITNWNEIPDDLKNLKLNVSRILSTKINRSLQLPAEIMALAPDREPCMPLEGWHYRVADPFMPTQSKQNVFDAISSGSISSAGFWPRMMSTKLKDLFCVPVAQPCSNGFTALMLALQAVHVGKEDEVILPSMTMVAVANSVAFLGARPVFVDCSRNNYNPGWEEIKNSITPKTKAIILTHTYGVPNPDLEKIVEECKAHGLWLIEDISECVGVEVSIANGNTKLLGTFGDFACASMYVNKMVHAGDGGFIIAKDPKFDSRFTSLVNHGFTPSYHFVHFEVAANAKINGLGAAMACGCIEEIETVMEHRKMLADVYRTLLKSLPVNLMPICGPNDTPWVFGVECENKQQRTQMRQFLAQSGIETRDFFFPLHLQPAFGHLFEESKQKDMSRSEKLGSTGFYLPTHSNLKMSDLHFISSVVRAFFDPVKEIAVKLIDPAPPREEKIAVQINPDSFRVEVRGYNSSGALKRKEYRGHLFVEAVKLSLEAEECLIHERWDAKNQFLSRVATCIEEAKIDGFTIMEEFFTPYIKYFQTQMSLEQPDVKPWYQVDLDSKEYLPAQTIPTTTDSETLQLLIWIVKETRPETIWEIGCWFGHATYLMAAAGREMNYRQRIFACDAFRWQNWMGQFANMDKIIEGSSFRNEYFKNVKKYQENIETVDWPYTIEKLPDILLNQKPNLVFLDITQDDEDLEEIWKMIKPQLISNETIILFNGLALTSIPFFTRHAQEIIPLAKPNTIAKVFKFVKVEAVTVGPETNEIMEDDTFFTLYERKVNFALDPSWDHHHKNLFCDSIQLLRKRLHSDTAPVLFVPAVEERMCDDPVSFTKQPWIGIIHSVEQYKELFYTPDLERLCYSPCYAKMMKQCKGLYTLTKFQSNYLKANLPPEFSFPIQTLVYPAHEVSDLQPSLVSELWKQGNHIDLILIGSFARDFDMFFKENIPVNLKKVLLAGDSVSREAGESSPENVIILDRVSGEDYENLLRKSLIFLSLKYDGAANTLILECISRSLPIVAPDMESCKEYLGENYPLFYSPKNPNLNEIITLPNIEKAIKYLQTMDKSIFHPNQFIESIEKGAVLLSLPPTPESVKRSTASLDLYPINTFQQFDVTLCICSYKRTHHLKRILDFLWNKQDYSGKIQIIIWNNNDDRASTVREICSTFIQNSTLEKSVELINSTANYYCSIRFAMPALMKSDCLLICDDDVLPNENFVSFFMSAREMYPNDVLCLRGHSFFPHKLDADNPTKVWHEYDNLKFHGDESPEKFIHFVHADACLIPRKGLEQVASVEMPDPSFALVDDYWMSFVLNHYFGRRLRKLSTAKLEKSPIERTDDSETSGLALHTRREVKDARIRMYIHHMLQGWPKWPENSMPSICTESIKRQKRGIWDTPFIGFNISSMINKKGIEDLEKLGVHCVRIGAVGVGRQLDFELSGFLSKGDKSEAQLQELGELVELLSLKNISVVLTLERTLVSASTWKMIAAYFANNPFMVGYDLINEPYTPYENEICVSEVSASINDPGVSKIENEMIELISAIREVDKLTPIIIEPTFWAHKDALTKLPIANLLKYDPDLIVSFHFYEPMLLTQRGKNKGRFAFPGIVPVFDNTPHSETIYWDEKLIQEHFQFALDWGQTHGVKIFLGEFGICRDIYGADEYLKALLAGCNDLGLIGFLFSFRDEDWEAMDYELGSHPTKEIAQQPNWQKGLMKIIVEGILRPSL